LFSKTPEFIRGAPENYNSREPSELTISVGPVGSGSPKSTLVESS